MTDLSAIYAQLAAGSLDFHTALGQEDVLKLKKDNPKLVMYQRPFYAKGSGGIFFGRKPGSPWNDDRVRKALAMNMDADLWGDNASNRKKFEAEGLPVDVNGSREADPVTPGTWTRRRTSWARVSKNLKYDPAEAKKLLRPPRARSCRSRALSNPSPTRLMTCSTRA